MTSPSERDAISDQGRDRFDPGELAEVLSHWDLGVISRISEYARGSRRSPKVKISAAEGVFLLKRRAPARSAPDRVQFAHRIQKHLMARSYPVAPLIPTRTGVTALEREGRTYELFAYIDGERARPSVVAAVEAGRALGRFHRDLDGIETDGGGTANSYHDADNIEAALRQIPRMVAAVEPEHDPIRVETTCSFLHEAYADAARRATAAGVDGEPPAIVHGDWHPGNVLFREGHVVAVLDFDSIRVEPRVMDVANGALQFAMSMRDSGNPARWPAELDAPRIGGLLRGYDLTAARPLTGPERAAVPWLIAEALVVEAVIPIAATGRFAQLSGSSFLTMVERKIRWLRPRSAKLATYLGA